MAFLETCGITITDQLALQVGEWVASGPCSTNARNVYKKENAVYEHPADGHTRPPAKPGIPRYDLAIAALIDSGVGKFRAVQIPHAVFACLYALGFITLKDLLDPRYGLKSEEGKVFMQKAFADNQQRIKVIIGDFEGISPVPED